MNSAAEGREDLTLLVMVKHLHVLKINTVQQIVKLLEVLCSTLCLGDSACH